MYICIYHKMMKVSDYIANTINRFPLGYVFTYKDFDIQVNQKEAAIKALNRLVKSNQIKKISKGRYYKPESTPFGDLLPDQRQLVKDLLEDNETIVGYLTGYSIYNKLGLTTQMGSTIQIGKNETRPAFKRVHYTISFIKQKNTINKRNIPLLQILDAIRYIKKIPDTTISKACRRLMEILKDIPRKDLGRMTHLALKYSPATRALFGALLDEIGERELTDELEESLNPITKYKLPGADKALSTTKKWNIA